MKITVNIKVIKWHNDNLLTLTHLLVSNKSHNNYVAVKLFHTLNTKKMILFCVNYKAPSTLPYINLKKTWVD